MNLVQWGFLFPQLIQIVISVIRIKCHVRTTVKLKDSGKLLRADQGERSQSPPCWDFIKDPHFFRGSSHDGIS